MSTASGGKITKKQIEYIERVVAGREKRQKALNEYIAEKNYDSIESLSLSEASSVIDMLKGIPDTSSGRPESSPTSKQLSYIRSLTESRERSEAASKFLREKGKESIDLLTLEEASDLIDTLRNISVNAKELPGGRKATEKQIEYIKSLSSEKSGLDAVKKYLSRIGKKELDELDSREASDLIDKLRR